MKKITLLAVVAAITLSCNTATPKAEIVPDTTAAPRVIGTWKLLTGTLVDNVKGVTTVTDYTKGKSFIKILNGTHFAFFNHDLNKGKGADSEFSAGGGHYTLVGNQYTESLEYCNDRQWENNDFPFTLAVTNDTLVIKGTEKVDSLHINRLNTEVYVRVK